MAAGVYDQPPAALAYPEAKWLFYVWINGRPLALGPRGEDLTILPATFTWFEGAVGGTFNVGLIGMAGGLWNNLKVKVRPS